MAAIPVSPSSLCSGICRGSSRPSFSPPSISYSPLFPSSRLSRFSPPLLRHLTVGARSVRRPVRAVAEETVVPEGGEGQAEEEVKEEDPAAAEQPVSVPVSPSDVLTMFFKAEGTMSESAVPTVTKSLEETEGVNNLNVQVLEGIASVELTKQTTVQATGVASNLVEIIQGSGFKLQTLNLSFDDEEDVVN